MLRTPLLSAFLICFTIGLSAAAEPPIRPGDRIAIVGNTFADQLRIHGYLETLLLQQTRDNPISIRNLAWGGDMVSARDRPTGFPTEEKTLREHKTDVIIACFGMGESFAGENGLEKFRSQLANLIDAYAGKTYNGLSTVRLILVSPIACEDLGSLTPNCDKRNEELSAYRWAMQEVASDAKIHFVDLFETSRYLMEESEGPNLTNNGIHLNDYGYWAISHSFLNQLLANERSIDSQAWTLRIDAETQTTDSHGVAISDLSTTDSKFFFRVQETSPPRLPPPTAVPLPPQLDFVRDRLIVDHLRSGRYQLTIDGESIVTATAEAWAEGVAIDSSPAHQELEKFRSVVNDKNLQFTYSWKALNQVHIVGERRTSPSGQALPQEVIEFNQLANDLDEELRAGIELKTRNWCLTRTSD
ncbi:SGNH/GDSL hydrolase family protein [Thalassoglobus sp. JC818]|uniref:SGNH/GDSL hydrolase family protein n=1 Tax=Thalassoglobus sp. JC818 TaxID=3232136 RepID=UPI00345A1EB6